MKKLLAGLVAILGIWAGAAGTAQAWEYYKTLRVPGWSTLRSTATYWCPFDSDREYVHVTVFPDIRLAVVEDSLVYGDSEYSLTNAMSCLNKVLSDLGYEAVNSSMTFSPSSESPKHLKILITIRPKAR